jgi:DNA repair exonuclease SbcCD nuclease subunit
MRYPYLITSDQHAHSWSAFSTVDKDGVNSRLRTILNELRRAHDVLAEKGGDCSFYAGDLYHVRGRIEPAVFNPTFQAIEAIHDEYLDLAAFAVPGNHDLQGTEATSLGNAMQALGSIDRFTVDTTVGFHGDVIVIPWHQDLADLRDRLAHQAAAMKACGRLHKTDVIIHAPVNGVIKGIPDHGLEAAELAAYGFRRVFAGHYHDHRVFEDGKVISVGALTHQTWSDVGTKAGFLLVYQDRIEHVPTEAPLFVDLDVDAMGDFEGLGDLA